MATEVILPRVDMDMTHGKFGRWYFEEGESVEKGEPLFEIETDKAAMEIEAPASGVLRGLAANAGDELPVGIVVGWIFAPGEAYAPIPGGPEAATREPPTVAGEPARLAPADKVLAVGAAALRATPMARRIARQRGVVLSRLSGSGPNGRIQAKDVDAPRARQGAVDGVGLHRLWLSRGEGAPFVFLHGFGADLNAWRPLLGALKGARPILAIDLPGHGRSALSGPVDFETILGAVRSTLDKEAIGAAHLVGHSLGGAIAAALAERLSRLVGSLTLIAPAGLGPEINGAFLAGFLGARGPADLAPWTRLLARDEAALGSALVNTTLRQRADLHVEVAQEKIAAALFPDGTQAFSIRGHLAALAVPTKIVFGLEDRIIPARQVEGLPGAVALHLFANVGHMPHFEVRAAVARLIEEAAAAGEAASALG
jgi:pimeloyl-ACP methyl ester carboxylesterase